MKNLIFPILLFSLCFTSCRKEYIESPNTNSNFIKEAQNYFETFAKILSAGGFEGGLSAPNNTPIKQAKQKPIWNVAYISHIGQQKTVIVPIEYDSPFYFTSNLSRNYSYSISGKRKLLLFKDESGNFQVQYLTFLADSVYLKSKNRAFSGIILIENAKGKPEEIYIIEPDGSIKVSHANTNKQNNETQLFYSSGSTFICIYTEGYNYSAADPEGVYWSELVGCYTFWSPMAATDEKAASSDYLSIAGGGGGSYVSPVYNNFRVFSPDNPIPNAKEYFKCFSNSPGTDYRYQIALCVSQPEPGIRSAWTTQSPFNDDNNPVYVGHTYLILTQVTPTRTIVRNVGFYPANSATPYSPSDKGILNNDQLRDYDIKLTITMTSSQFFNCLDFINQASTYGSQYNLNTNNCSTFAINALNRAGCNIPSTRGTWHHGEGCNPGDLGEDIREMTLSSTMTRTTAYGTHANQGTCQ